MTRVRHSSFSSPVDAASVHPAMQRVASLCARAAHATLPVLMEGEAGVGKRFHARAIHDASDRAGRPFITADCATIAWGKLDSALFGIHRTGASSQPGLFRESHGGTLFLKEIGELDAPTQARLLRVIETGEIETAGGRRPDRVNVRVIAGSSHRLLNLARDGSFREDLYYRLAVLPIYIPALRERRPDIVPLASRLTARFSADMGKAVVGIAPATMAMLEKFDWPGNVRQLEQAVYRAVALAESSLLEPVDFPQIQSLVEGRDQAAKAIRDLNEPSVPVHIDRAIPRLKQMEGSGQSPDRFLTRAGEVTPLADLERELIIFALGKYEGRMSRIARALGIGRSTLYRKLREYGLEGELRSDAA